MQDLKETTHNTQYQSFRGQELREMVERKVREDYWKSKQTFSYIAEQS
jgi:septin family protein